jgi:adenosylcobinamide-phosphate synthase
MFFDSLSNVLLMCGFGMVAALVLDLLARFSAGWRRIWRAPAVAVVKISDKLEQRLNRAHRRGSAVRERGVVVTLVLLMAAALFGWLFHQLALALGPVGALVQIGFSAWCFSASGLLHAASRMRSMAEQARAEQLQAFIMPHVPKDTMLNDRYAMLRALLQGLAESVRDRMMAPLIGALLFGLPGLCAARMAAMLAQLWTRPLQSEHFSASVRSLWQALGAPASLLATTMLALATLITPGARALPAWRQWWLHAAQRMGTVAVLGGATGTQLAGPRIGDTKAAWVGEGTPKPNAHHFRVGIWLHQAARWLIALILICAALSLI